MQLQDLAAFLAVADDRSFSSAARRLHRTQPAISQAVRRIEDELGERLFDRSSRDGTLTEAGRLLQGTPSGCSAWLVKPRSRSASFSRSAAGA